MKSILLVGGCGYIGSYIYEKLIESNLSVVVCDRLTRGNNLGVEVLTADYASLSSEFISGFDAIIWFAGHSSVQQSINDPDGALVNNCLNLFDFAKRIKPTTKFIYASSGSLYSSSSGAEIGFSSEEDLIKIPYQNAYDISKFAFDYLAKNFLTNFYGLRMGTLSGYSKNLRSELVFNSMSISAAKDKKVFVKNKNASRTLLFIEDLWLFLKALMFSDVAPGFYNVGSVSMTIGELAKEIGSVWGAEIVDIGYSETYSFLLNTGRMDEIIKKDRPLFSISNRTVELMQQYDYSSKI